MPLFDISSRPGVKRDGSVFDGDYYNDIQWCRFNDFGRPTKMHGRRQLITTLAGPVRALSVYAEDGNFYFHSGSGSFLERFFLDSGVSASSITNRTPAGFPSSTDNVWSLDQMFDVAIGSTQIIGVAPPNLSSISNATTGEIYTGDVTGVAALTGTGTSCSGGICVAHPYVFYFGSNGQVGWSVPNSTTDYAGGGSGNARVTSEKVVAGSVARGGSASPSAMFWTLDSLVRARFTGGATIFAFDNISDQSSILSSRSVVEYDGVFFWPGIDRFLVFNGVVKEMQNTLNREWFYNGLNLMQRQKVWGTKVTSAGEIWWFYPRGSATECTNAAIYNVRLNTWYDCTLARSAGVSKQVYSFPIWVSDVDPATATASAWRHEEDGYDEITATGQTLAIDSYFETQNFGFTESTQGPGEDVSASVSEVEPDFIGSGAMSLELTGSQYAQGADVTSPTPYPFTVESTPFIPISSADRSGRSQVRFRFRSNAAGAWYEAGKNMALIEKGAPRR